MYSGQVALISLGRGGLHTDDPQDLIPPTDLIIAKNISYGKNLAEKEPGSRRWNFRAPLPSPIVAFYDWWPDEITQRVICVCRNGKVYRFSDAYNFTEVTATGTAPASLTITGNAIMVSGGNETGSNARKLFILTGNNPIQVISGDGTTRRNITLPASDWPDTGSVYPTMGLIHRSRFFVMGDRNHAHRIYGSNPSDHEDFQTSNQIYTENIYPGEGERLISAVVFKSRLFFFKFPSGAYFLNDDSQTASTWFSEKISSSFGGASAHCAVEAGDDLYIANSEGSITSLKAVQSFGDVESSNVFQMLKNESFMRESTSQDAVNDIWAMYYRDKKIAMFAYKSAGSTVLDKIGKIDISVPGLPRVSWTEKDQANCLGLVKDIKKVGRPVYGSDDGYLYEMDVKDRWISGLFAPTAPNCILAGSGAGNVDNGDHYYRVTFFNGSAETNGGYVSSLLTVTDKTTDGQVSLSAIPTDPSGVATGRKIYRKSLTNTTYKLLTTINDNTTVVYTDNTATASLGADCPLTNGFDEGYEARIQTPHMDMSFINPAQKESMKLWDFLEVTFEPTGRWNVTVDVHIDGVFTESIDYEVSFGAVLDDFVLDNDVLSDRIPRAIRKPLHGSGRRISLVFRNSGVGQNFKIQNFGIYYRAGAQNQTPQEP